MIREGYFRALEFRHATPQSLATGVSGRSHSHSKNGRRKSSFLDPVLSTEIGLVAFKDDMRVAFVLENIVYSSYASPWLQLSAQRKHGELAFEACQALCQSVFGKCYNLPDEEVRGISRALSPCFQRVGQRHSWKSNFGRPSCLAERAS